jgi:hypothetical protein
VLRILGGDPTIGMVEAELDRRGHASPGVRALMLRFGTRWAALRSLALADRAERSKMLGTLQHRGEFTGDEQDIFRALRAVALRLGRLPLAITYDLPVRDIHEEWISQQVDDPPWLPTSATILARMPWRAALERAGLTLAAKDPCQSGMAEMAEAVDACIEELGVLPSVSLLDRWSKARLVRLPERRTRPPWPEVLAEVRRLRAERGADTPPRETLPRHAPPIPITPDWARTATETACPEPVQPITGIFVTDEEAVVSLARYVVRYTSRRRPPRAKHYKQMRQGDPELASTSALARIADFQELVARAERLIATEGPERFAARRLGGGAGPNAATEAGG